MKIDRRCFLSLSIGAGAGIALSPLPWKLTDDLSIWTQNWPWTPVPETGETTFVNTTCTLCPGGCGITVRKVDNRAVKIEGMTDHPVNQGGICSLGLSGLQLLYGPTRIRTPLKRSGERGEGKWTPISWEQAITQVAEKLSAIRDSGSPQSLAAIDGSTSPTVSRLIDRFLTVFGSPNHMTVPGFLDSYRTAQYLNSGVSANPGFDLEKAGYVLSFGAGLLDGWGSPVRSFQANSIWKKNQTRVVQIESRLSRTAAKADFWIAVNPGTEADLALGIAHVMIREALFNAEFVNNHCHGFPEFSRMVLEDYSPESVSKTTGVDAAAITMMARDFGKARRPLALCGRGQGNVPGAMNEYLAVQSLNALAGSIHREGGFWAVPEFTGNEWPAPGLDAVAQSGKQQPRVDNAGSEAFPMAKSLLNQFPAMLASGKGYPIQALLVAEANPLYTLADSRMAWDALKKIPFIVSFSSFMDETAMYADLVLPNHVYLERLEDSRPAAGFHRPIAGMCLPVVPPQFDTRPLGDALISLAQEMGGTISEAFPWENFEKCLEATWGNSLKTLKTRTFLEDTSFRPASWSTAFHTQSRKWEFFPSGSAPGKMFASLKVEGDPGAFPILLVPVDTMRISSGYIGNPPFMTKTVEESILLGTFSLVEINPKTAQGLGLKEGDTAALQTPKGQAVVKIHLEDGIMPGVMALPRGLGHMAYDRYLAGKGVNTNRLIGSIPDPVSGLDAAWGIRAKLSKA